MLPIATISVLPGVFPDIPLSALKGFFNVKSVQLFFLCSPCKASPAGVSAGDELNVEETVQGISEKDAQQAALAKAAFEAVTVEYKQLEAAITDSGKRKEMLNVYQQPWLQ